MPAAQPYSYKDLGIIEHKAGISKVFLFGPEMAAAAEKVSGSYHTDKKELLEAIKNSTFDNALILIKGSRSMGLEAALDAL